jgi:ABC-2 type transport system ATP-binding protein
MNTDNISISVQNVTKKFGSQTALSNISINFDRGMIHGVIGPEGAGKTTLMRMLLKLLDPNEGNIEFKKNNAIINFEDIRSCIAYMPQTQSLYPDLSVQEHLEFFRELYSISMDKYNTLSKELLNITRLAPFMDRPAGKLSGGMYKKLGLICALLRSPQVVLLDEPTNGVDPISRREFWELLYNLSEQKILIIVTTSYMDEAARCHVVHLMEDGHLITEGEPKTLLQKENVNNFDELFIKHNKLRYIKDDQKPPDIIIPNQVPLLQSSLKKDTAFAVYVTNLTVKFNDFIAVNNVSFDVKKGEIFGFLGANGAGKTTTIRVLCGLLTPTSGDVEVSGVDFKKDNGQSIKFKIGYMSQRFTLYDDLSVEENLFFISSLRKMDAETYRKRKADLLAFISFDRPLSSKVGDLPSGIKQHISLVGALLHDPEIVFLDEPTAGVTPASRARFWALIQKVIVTGKTVFVTTHYMDEAEQCHRIALMRDGELIALDSPANLKQKTFPDATVSLEDVFIKLVETKK